MLLRLFMGSASFGERSAVRRSPVHTAAVTAMLSLVFGADLIAYSLGT